MWPVSEMSVWDVARGYRSALARAIGEDNIKDYWLNIRTQYHAKTLGKGAEDHIRLSQYASEGLLNEALYFGADVVFMVSILNVHPVVLWALRKVGIHVAALLTESPYDDENQANTVEVYPEMSVFTHEIVSAEKYGWHYLPHAYDPEVHKPYEPEFADECDVLLVGTGWTDRQQLLELVDWSGIDLRLYGIWPMMTPDSPLFDKMWPVCVDNTKLPQLYSAAKICLNIHRAHPDAKSLNPRSYEIAACGAFQLSDQRIEVSRIFRNSVPVFRNGDDLGRLVRMYLSNDPLRRELAAESARAVAPHTFDARLQTVLPVLDKAILKRRVA